MVNRSRSRKRLSLSMKLNLWIMVAFSMMILWGIFLVRERLLQNAQQMGTSLAESYAREEENRLAFYKVLMEMGVQHIDEQVSEGADNQDIQAWLSGYFELLKENFSQEVMNPYAVIGGKLLGSALGEEGEDYDFYSAQWYQLAMEADSKAVLTDVYENPDTGKKMITIAQKSKLTDNILAFDIPLDKLHIVHCGDNRLPQGSSYYLFDGNRQLIYYVSGFNASQQEVAVYAKHLLEGIDAGKFSAYNAIVKDLAGNARGVYYCNMENGWTSVLTIPINQILLGEVDGFMILLSSLFLGLFLIMAAVVVRSAVNERKMFRISEAMQTLGDAYYAIYRVNFAKETYEMIKAAPDMREKVGKRGDYGALLRELKNLVDGKVYEEFSSSFSCESIRRLIQERITDFGGDYQRRFGEVYKWVNIRVIYNEVLGPDEVIFCFREVDAEKKRQLDQQLLLETSLESAQKNMKSRNLFFSSISHDMRTPLNAVIGLAELAKRSAGDANKVQEYAEKIGQSGQQLLTLINDILDMSKLEQSGESVLDYRPMDLCRCVEDGISIFTDQAREEEKKLELHFDVRDPMVLCDPFRITQILNNLVSNAIKYSFPGAEIQVGLRQLSAEAGGMIPYQLTVRDTGIGMSKEFLERIFEPFTRETVFAPTKIKGTGLGMPIVKALVGQMNGEITVESYLGEGSLFTVTLPLAAAEQVTALERKDGDSGKPDLTGKVLLLAEDNEINMEIATAFLEDMGARVVQAWNGREAVERFAASEPGELGAILMDMQMPELDGCGASREIRAMKRPDAAKIPIIAVTANTFAEDMERIREAGMNGYISKPLEVDKLQKVLEGCLRQGKDGEG